MKYIYIIFLILISLGCFSQKEANIWYFGNHAGVDFNTGVPIALTDGALTTLEGCATISDKFGSLLFYTDGITSYNKLHVAMPNGTGLKGNSSATQSGVIVPKPGSTTIFYIFTVDCCGGINGLHYSEVDMTLDGGKGDITITKNILLKAKTSEKITAVLHSNKKDIWVIASDYRANNFQAYLVTSAGVGLPVVSIAGLIPAGAAEGYLKSSSNGKYLVQDVDMASLEVLNFDNTTGIVSNWFNFAFSGAYGAEFSPDATKLYATKLFSADIYQYDLSSGSPPAIIASELIVGTMTGIGFWKGGALQVGPDKKMYITKYSSSFLACFTNPNNLGAACGFIDNAVSLSGKTGQLGLPNFIQSYFSVAPFTYTNICLGMPTNFLVQDSTLLTSINWNFGDPASGLANTSPFYAPNHMFTSVGTYTVKAIVTSTCCPNDTLIDVITIKDKPYINIGHDTSLCVGATFSLSVPNLYNSYLWNTAATTNSITVGAAGKYWVKVTNECGIDSDTIQITELNKPAFNLGNDTMICDGTSLDLKVISTYSVATYEWNDATTSSSITTSSGGKYWVKATNQCGSVTDTIIIDKHFKPIIALRNDTSLCFLEPINLSVTSTYTNYLWQDGSTAPSLTTNGFGTYWIKVTNECGSTSDTFHLKQLDIKPIFTLGNDTTFCFEESMTLFVKPFKSYLWDNGSINSSRLVTEEGNYWVKVWNECGNNSDTIKVGYQYCHLIIPNVVTSNGDGVNDYFKIRGLQLGVADLKVLNRWGNPVYESKGYNNDWKPSDVTDGVYYYIMNYPPDNKTYTGFVTVFSGK